MKASKRFRWEAAHRLPWHTGGCQNLHGHSYEMWVELEGTPDDRGMLIDFKEIKKVMGPLVEGWDHAVLVADYDAELKQAIEVLGSKHFVFPYDTTSENMCQYVADYLGHEALDVMLAHKIASIRVKVLETETCFAELEVSVANYLTNGKVTTAASVAS